MTVAVLLRQGGTEPGLHAGRRTESGTSPPEGAEVMRHTSARAVLVLLAQIVLVAGFAWASNIPVGGFTEWTRWEWGAGQPDPNWYTTHTLYGEPFPWLESVHAKNQAAGIDATRWRVTNPALPVAAVLIALGLPRAVAGWATGDALDPRWSVALAAGLGGLAVGGFAAVVGGDGSWFGALPRYASRSELVHGGVWKLRHGWQDLSASRWPSAAPVLTAAGMLASGVAAVWALRPWPRSPADPDSPSATAATVVPEP